MTQLKMIKPIDPAIMKRMLTVVNEMDPERRQHPESRVVTLMTVFEDETTLNLIELLPAFELRMVALTRLRDHPSFDAWSEKVPGRTDGQLIHEALLEAAATQPVIEDAEKKPAFEPKAFFEQVLSRSEPEGQG